MTLDASARSTLTRADLEDQQSELSLKEDWLTVKEFANLVNMPEHSVREAIRKKRLAFPIVRLTTGKKGAIRIIVPRRAA